MLKTLRLVCLLLLGFWLYGCKEPTIEEDFIALYSELILASGYYGNMTTNGAVARKQILDHYQYDKAKFDAQLAILKENPKLWTSFVEDVVFYLEERKAIKEEPNVPN